MCWALESHGEQTGRQVTRLMVLIAALAVAEAGAQDLAPRAVRDPGAAPIDFGTPAGPAGEGADHTAVLLASLVGLEVVGDDPEAGTVQSGRVRLQGMTVDDLAGLGRDLADFLDRPLTVRGLDALTDVILNHYDHHRRPMNEVWIPPQDGEGGLLRVEVIEGRIGQVGITRLSRFDERVLRKGIHLREGARLSAAAAQGDVDWLSRNPFRRASLFVAPGEGVTADLLLKIDEQRPWRVYAGYDNSGSEAVGSNRWFGGVNWGNGFGVDHVLGYQFTMGDDLDDFHAHALSWEIPLHALHHFVTFNAAWAEVSATGMTQGLPIVADGTSWQIGAAYGLPLPRLGGWTQEVRGGIELKHADNFIGFGATALPGLEVEVVQARAEWRGAGALAGGEAEVLSSFVVSPGEVTGRNGGSEFEAFRTGADPTYLAGRIEADWDRPLPGGWEGRVRGAAQVASGALLPTEQFVLGGWSSVRGYPDRDYLADAGYFVSAELLTPAIRPMAEGRGVELAWRGLLFVDHGIGWREGDGGRLLNSVGLGTRLSFGDAMTARLDLAWPLESPGEPELHAGVFLSF